MQAVFQNIVIDLEFAPTPKEVGRQGLRNEIIEIGAVRVDGDGNAVDTFCRRVKPERVDHIAPWITGLTGIRDADVREAETFAEVLGQFCAWVGSGRIRLVAWSGTDRRQIERECAFKGIEQPAQLDRWFDLQRIYPRLMGVGDRRHLMSLKTAADWTGAALNADSAHQALYDAQVTAELLRQIVTGEYRQQKRALAENMGTPSQDEELTASLGSRCSRLGELYRELLAQAG